jgi:hypothetical protein
MTAARSIDHNLLTTVYCPCLLLRPSPFLIQVLQRHRTTAQSQHGVDSPPSQLQPSCFVPREAEIVVPSYPYPSYPLPPRIPLMQQLLHMLTKPIIIQIHHPHIPRPLNRPLTLPTLTKTLKRLLHTPLRTRIKERQLIPLPQSPLQIRVHADLPPLHIEDQGRRAGVIDVHEVAVELDVQGGAGLDGGVGDGCGRGGGYAGEDGACGEGDEAVGGGGEGAGALFDAHEAGEVGGYPGGDLVVGAVGFCRGLGGGFATIGGGRRGRAGHGGGRHGGLCDVVKSEGGEELM